MAYEIKNNTFSLFENDKKGNEKAPDLKGKGLVDGKEVKVAVWKRKSQSGVEYWSGVVEETVKQEVAQPVEEPKPEDVSDAIPF